MDMSLSKPWEIVKGSEAWRAAVHGATKTEHSTIFKSWLIWKDSDAGKDLRQEEKGMTEEEMVGWHHQLNGHEFEQALGDDEG